MSPSSAGEWKFDAWKAAHASDAPKLVTSQSGRQDLEPLLSPTEDDQPRRILTLAEWAKRRQVLRAVLEEVLGPPPTKKPPLDAKILSEEKRDGLIFRKVTYVSEEGEVIPAYLLLPQGFAAKIGAKPTPAVICLHQTNALAGKREPCGMEGDASLAFALQLAQRGYVTLAPDAICFGERYRSGKPYKHYGDAPEFFQTHPRWSVMGKMVWDVGRAIDYLATVEGVDREKIGCIGHSHGAYGTIFAMALDERIQVGVASCGFTSFRTDPRFERWFRLTALMPRLGFFEGRVREIPFDMHHVLALIAPRPFFNSAALDDRIFPGTDNMPSINDDVRKVFALYNAAGAFESRTFRGGHWFPPEVRDQTYAFLDQWLLGKGPAGAPPK